MLAIDVCYISFDSFPKYIGVPQNNYGGFISLTGVYFLHNINWQYMLVSDGLVIIIKLISHDIPILMKFESSPNILGQVG
jgi:hypothetical protein